MFKKNQFLIFFRRRKNLENDRLRKELIQLKKNVEEFEKEDRLKQRIGPDYNLYSKYPMCCLKQNLMAQKNYICDSETSTNVQTFVPSTNVRFLN